MTTAAPVDTAQSTIQQTAHLLNNINHNEQTTNGNTAQHTSHTPAPLYIIPPLPQNVLPAQSPTTAETAKQSPHTAQQSPNSKQKKSPKAEQIPVINPADYPNMDPEILARMSPAELKRCFRAPQKQRRSSNQLADKERWYCSNGCGVAYKNTSTKSIKSHQLECIYTGPNLNDTVKQESGAVKAEPPTKKKRVDASAAEALLSLITTSSSSDTSTAPAVASAPNSTATVAPVAKAVGTSVAALPASTVDTVNNMQSRAVPSQSASVAHSSQTNHTDTATANANSAADVPFNIAAPVSNTQAAATDTTTTAGVATT